MKILKDKTITDVPGIKAIGIHCGIKKDNKKDLCLIYSEVPAIAAATFTTNNVKAAPIQVNLEHIKSKNTQAIIVNSGNANACTGEQGYKDALLMAETTSNLLGLSTEEVLIGSTGIIGVPLPMDAVLYGIKSACNSLDKNNGYSAAEAIMTTDKMPKMITIEIFIDDKPVIIGGIAKGSGMIHPNMATMLSFIVTNVNIEKDLLSEALKESVDNTYNMISVDGDTSTNDMVVALANGTANNTIIDEIDENYMKFKEGLNFVNTELAKMIAKDGEGATKLIEVSLYNTRTLEDAKLCAKQVITSNLVKSAFFGTDANWGRIMCSLGYSGGNFEPEKVEIYFQNHKGCIQIVNKGIGIPFDEKLAKEILEQDYIKIAINLNDGNYKATAWGCDLSYEYVRINGCYKT